jgi:RimJ/RimL family protein N-acetyltransferase/SAM-dependent methyltransferase
MTVELRRIRADEWRELRDIRLRALLDAPDAFGATHEREAEDPEQEWIEWAADSAEGGSSFTVVASDGGRWIGLAVGAPDRDHPGQAGLFAMWVDPAARGRGIGRRLVAGVLAWAQASGFPVIRLRVTIANEAAMRLYERCGFVDTGERATLRDGSDVITASMMRSLELVTDGTVDALLAEQIRYYDDRAAEYEDLWFRRGRYDVDPAFNEAWFRETATVEAAADAFDASGAVLEIACGSGLWTWRLAPRAHRLVAVDSSSAMLELNRRRFDGPNVEYVRADVFAWDPGKRFDAAFAGFFVSHVPPDRFRAFFARLASWLEPGAELFLVDDVVGPDRPYSGDAVEGGPAFAHRRRLADGREYVIVKCFYEPKGLVAALDDAGWDADIMTSGVYFLYGTARPR